MVDLALIFIPLYNEMFRGCFTVGKEKYQKLMINGEFVIEWKKEKSTPIVLTVGEHGCGSHSCH